MKSSPFRNLAPAFIVFATAAIFFSVGQRAQSNAQLPQRVGHVNDFARVLAEAKRQELETLLGNLKLKTGIQFDVATVDTTGEQDIFDFSRQLATRWGVGTRTTTARSLLLVVSLTEKNSFTQFSRSAQRDLPDGVLGEISQQLRKALNSGQPAEGIEAAVGYFVSSLAQKKGVALDELKTRPAVAQSTAASSAGPDPAIAPPAATSAPDAVSVRSSGADRPRAIAGGPESNDADSEKVELTLTLPFEARVKALKEFLLAHPDSNAKSRAIELLVSARAAWGDELLRQGRNSNGVEQLMLAISEAPLDASEKLFSGVIAKIPLNLYLRGERAAADNAAQTIATRFAADPIKLLAVAGFYINIERGDEAIQFARQALAAAPDLAEAHESLGLALHISLRLDEAANEYKRALELNPNARIARRSLADLRRAFGKNEEALALYREQLKAEPADSNARAGLVMALLELGRTEEAKTELDSALQTNPRNVSLLAGAAYWFVAHNDSEQALTLGNRALEIEPRYTWLQIAVARALLAQRRPLEAERAIRFARLHGRFPTLDYELATTLVAAGLYEEAAEVLLQTFRFENNEIKTRLGGRTAAAAASFIELLAPERRASIFQFSAADSEANAKVLRDLLAFATVLNAGTDGGGINEANAAAAAKEFASGTDAARAYRELYAASRLLQKGIAFQTAYELAEAARDSVDAAMTVPALTVAVQADEYRDIRARAIAAGGTPDIPDAPRNILSNMLRGRIEEISGWSLFNQDKVDEAVDHLRRAVSVLPEGTPALKTSLWHLAAALERQGKNEEALGFYIRSYNAGDQDAVRRAVIEKLYRQVHGSLEGLDERIGAAPVASAPYMNVENQPTAAPTGNSTAPVSEAVPALSPEITASPAPEATPTATPENKPVEAHPSPVPAEPVPVPSPEASPDKPMAQPTPEAPAEVPAKPRETFVVSGLVIDANGSPLTNVVVVLISAQGTVLTTTTNESGSYSFTVAPSDHGYRLIPSRDGFVFAPSDKVLPSVNEDQKEVNFTGSRRPRN